MADRKKQDESNSCVEIIPDHSMTPVLFIILIPLVPCCSAIDLSQVRCHL